MILETAFNTITARFWAHVDKDGPPPPHLPHLGPCWLWTGAKINGYGKFSVIGGLMVSAHRLSWELCRSPLPVDRMVLHHCDIRACVRPEHLFLGTALENARDMCAKGRSATGERSGASKHPERVRRGDQNGAARLTRTEVEEIRQLQSVGVSQVKLAALYGVSRSNIGMIVHGLTWKP